MDEEQRIVPKHLLGMLQKYVVQETICVYDQSVWDCFGLL